MIVNEPANAARHQPQPSSPALVTAPQTCLRHGGMQSANRKNVPITKTVMNVVSLVANDNETKARSAPDRTCAAGR